MYVCVCMCSMPLGQLGVGVEQLVAHLVRRRRHGEGSIGPVDRRAARGERLARTWVKGEGEGEGGWGEGER